MLCLITCFSFNVSAQRIEPSNGIYNLPDSAIFKPHTVKPKKEKLYHPDSTHSPFKAVMESAFLPGLGQIYNHKWWKAPFIYTGFSLLTITIIYNYRHYQQDLIIYNYYNNPLKAKAGMPDYAYYQTLLKYNYTQTQVADAYNVDYRDFELGILGAAGLWVIQMVDAYIDAKFIHAFSMDNNLTFKVSPVIIAQPAYASNYNTSFMPVLKLTLGL
jgi:hypothetical protein